jgi:hypothetical protein
LASYSSSLWLRLARWEKEKEKEKEKENAERKKPVLASYSLSHSLTLSLSLCLCLSLSLSHSLTHTVVDAPRDYGAYIHRANLLHELVRTAAQVGVCVSTYMCIIHIYIYIYIGPYGVYTQTHKHTHTHTHTHRFLMSTFQRKALPSVRRSFLKNNNIFYFFLFRSLWSGR